MILLALTACSDPKKPNCLQKREGLYKVIEIDPKEVTLSDMSNKKVYIIDLTSEEVHKLSIEGISENDIFAEVYSNTTVLGNTAISHFNTFDKN